MAHALQKKQGNCASKSGSKPIVDAVTVFYFFLIRV